MSKLKMRVAVAAASLAVLAGVSVATAGSAAASARIFGTLAGCQTAGNTLAQQGELIGYECVPTLHGGYYLYTW
ncbi:hypothetical protein RM844_15365 [Streptomyces sp. DSM 44915]|uniref:Uncharacterized protein n=1 Tax=Streptomyces chisholmiae TaxID=3075540 RepID=A0ABU2JRR8_9ACTN|nr:hypothetical protein [Streptomyces sp. DSM 44915]MDT0267665.1 hypothetical protein [Streptomyces sp. DSM 44915]